MTHDRRTMRALTAILVAGLLGLGAIGCASAPATSVDVGTISASDSAGPSDDASSGIDEPVEEESPEGELPTLAPVPDSVKPSAACDKAYRAWMELIQATLDDDPNATAAALAPEDQDKIERTVFEKCSLIDLAAANRDHPVVLDPDEDPVPYIDDDVISFVAGMCDEDIDVIGGTALCQVLPSPMP